jgi:MFS transporter, DHA2 family, methylenomycin A resistance protein
MTSAMLGAIPRERSGVASGVLNTVRQAAGALGVAIAAALIARSGAVVGIHVLTMLCVAVLVTAIGIATLGIRCTSRNKLA